MPQVDGEMIDLSDVDHNQPMVADDNGIIDMTQLGDSDEATPAPTPSKSVRKSGPSNPTRPVYAGGIPRPPAGICSQAHSSNPQIREVNGVFEILDSDEEEPSPPLRTSEINADSSATPLRSALIAGNKTARSPLDSLEPEIVDAVEDIPTLEFLPSQNNMEIHLEANPCSPVIFSERNSKNNSMRNGSPFDGDHPAPTAMLLANSDSIPLQHIQSLDEIMKSPVAVETSNPSNQPASIEPSSNMPMIAPGLVPVLAADPVVSVPSSNFQSPMHQSVEAPSIDSLPHPVVPQTVSDLIRPPNPVLVVFRTDPSVPPRPAANAIDWGPRHHGPDGLGLFKHVLRRSGPSQNRCIFDLAAPSAVPTTPSPSFSKSGITFAQLVGVNSDERAEEAQPSFTAEAEVQTTIETDVVGAHVARHLKDKESITTRGPYRTPDGESLKDVIIQAYKPLNIMDLIPDDDGKQHHPVETVPENVLHGARWLDNLLAMERDPIAQEDLGKGKNSAPRNYDV